MIQFAKLAKSRFNLGLPLAFFAFLLCGGCSGSGSSAPHRHGVHGGHLMAVQGKPDIEFELAKDDQHPIVVYVVETATSQPHPISAENLQAAFRVGDVSVPMVLESKPQEDDPAGLSSRFIGSLERLPQQLLVAKEFHATIAFEEDGQTRTAEIYHRRDCQQ